MFYSKKEFHAAVEAKHPSLCYPEEIYNKCSTNGKLSRKKTGELLAEIKEAILNRESFVIGNDRYGYEKHLGTGKFARPWSIVPALRDFTPPPGDFGVGVEIEYGFTSDDTAKTAMFHVRNWKHVTLDREGGYYGVETTFPPILYSKLTKRDKPFRYLDYLAANASMLSAHSGYVGTHINVSASTRLGGVRMAHVAGALHRLSEEQKLKYFNRRPYGYLYPRSENEAGNGYVEFKLFNSTTCSITLRRYINIAVSLVKLIASEDEITDQSVLAALEEGYNKRSGHPKQPAA